PPRAAPGSASWFHRGRRPRLPVSPARLVLVADGQLAVLVADADDGAVAHVAAEQGAPDPGLDLAADEPAQRPRPVDRVVALPGDEAPGVRGDLQLHLPLAEPGPQVVQHEVDDALDLGLGERLEQ